MLINNLTERSTVILFKKNYFVTLLRIFNKVMLPFNKTVIYSKIYLLDISLIILMYYYNFYYFFNDNDATLLVRGEPLKCEKKEYR